MSLCLETLRFEVLFDAVEVRAEAFVLRGIIRRLERCLCCEGRINKMNVMCFSQSIFDMGGNSLICAKVRKHLVH